jgi:hypothetical protein
MFSTDLVFMVAKICFSLWVSTSRRQLTGSWNQREAHDLDGAHHLSASRLMLLLFDGYPSLSGFEVKPPPS